MFQIVVVCTGNRNRSPIAEAAFKRAAEGLPVSVSSVGLLDLGCAPALPETIEVAASLGLDLSAHRSCSITDVDLSEVDLLLGLEWQHVAAAVIDYQAPKERCFTLLELAELVQEVPDVEEDNPVRRAKALVNAAYERKKETRGSMVGATVSDPFGGPISGYVEMAQLVKRTSERIVEKLFGVPVAPPLHQR